MKCRVVLFYIYSSSHQNPGLNLNPPLMRSLIPPPQSNELSLKSSSERGEGEIKEEEEEDHHMQIHHTQGIIVQELMETLSKYASWYCFFLAPNSQILLKGVASSKGTTDSRWSELISKCSGSGKVLKISLDAALRNVSQWEKDLLGERDRLIEYGERPSSSLRHGARRRSTVIHGRTSLKRKREAFLESDDLVKDDEDDDDELPSSWMREEEEEGDQSNFLQEEEEEEGQKNKSKRAPLLKPRKRIRKIPRLSIEDVIQASNLYELCEKKGIAQEKLSASDYYQYVRARKLLEKHNEIPLQYIGTSSGKIDEPFEYLPYFEWQSFLLERMISKRPIEDKRKIIFLVDPIGNNGKSVFFQWLSSLPAGTINKYLPSSSSFSSANPLSGGTKSEPSDTSAVVSGATNKTPKLEVVNDSCSCSGTSKVNIKREENFEKLQSNIIEDSADENNIDAPADLLKDEHTQENILSHHQQHQKEEEEIMIMASPINPREQKDEEDSSSISMSLSMRSMMSLLRDTRTRNKLNESNISSSSTTRKTSLLNTPSAITNNNIEFQYLTVDGNGKGSSSANDILYLVDCSQANLSTTQSIFLVDLARCEGQNLNYALLEKLKNGAWMSTKYEGKKASYKNGQVIVAMNELPDVTKLSQDRYEIYLIHNKKFAFEGKPIPVAKIPTLKKMQAKFLQHLLTLL